MNESPEQADNFFADKINTGKQAYARGETMPREDFGDADFLEEPVSQPELEIVRTTLRSFLVVAKEKLHSEAPLDRELGEVIEKAIAPFLKRYKEEIEGSSHESRDKLLGDMEIEFPFIDHLIEGCQENKDDPDMVRFYLNAFIKLNLKQHE